MQIALPQFLIAHRQSPVLLEQEDECLLLIGERADPMTDQRSSLDLARSMLRDPDQLARSLVDALIDQREEELCLATETPVHRSLGEASRRSYVLDARSLVAALSEYLCRGIEQPLARRSASFRSPAVQPRRSMLG